ncbi:putative immunity protein [Nocardia sp. bgisy118]|uniref:putative immunity protein n=1 Tax=Nocardia sp. bgisy118 TaxID=3413786 RepID=UPI003F4A6255
MFNDTVDSMNAADDNLTIELSMAELREVTGYAVACAEPVLAIFERDCPDDPRPRAVLDEARRFAAGGKRTKALRVTALDAHRAARAAGETHHEAAVDAARAAGHAGGAAYLHPLAKATQGGHILMSAAHAARALELDAGDDRSVGDEYIEKATSLASPLVVSVLRRYPPAPSGRGRVGELWRKLDASLRENLGHPKDRVC